MYRTTVSACLVALVCRLTAVAQSADPAQSLIAAGPMLGHATETEVTVWVQTTSPSWVEIVYWPEDDPTARKISKKAAAMKETACCAHVRIEDLAFGATYGYEVLVGGELAPRPYPTRFRTQPHWRFRTDPPDFTVALGSCSYINEPAYDRPDQTYGGDPSIYGAIHAANPDLMLWLGDNVYYREPDWTSASGMRRRYSHDRRLPILQPLLASTNHYAIWDDHDYGPNNSDWTFSGRRTTLETFKQFWANPSYGLEDHPGVFTRFTWGDVEFFLLDDRYHRKPNRMPDGPGKVMFGRRQMEWLLDALTNSNGVFKVVAAGNQMLNPLTPYEAFGNYPREQVRFLKELKRRPVWGVLFLSGDRHHTELIRLEEEGQYPLYDFTCSPLTSGVHVSERERDNPARVEGTWVNDARNFGLMRFAGPRGNRTVTLSARDAEGKVRWTHEIRSRDLRRPRKPRNSPNSK